MNNRAIVVHSGGMDSSLCLALAIKNHGKENVISLSFTYGQRHELEIEQAKKICADWGVEHKIINIDCLQKITNSALLDKDTTIKHDKVPNTLVSGRNGLMARIAAIHADSLGIDKVYMGVIEVEEANSGYRDCSRQYMDIVQKALRMDFDNHEFQIVTPLVFMTKVETMQLGYDLRVLEYLLEETITCYEGIAKKGCMKCPACKLRNEGILEFIARKPRFTFSYKNQLVKS